MVNVQRTLDAVGIHGSAVRCIPIFAVYLAVLVHTFNLARVKVLPLTFTTCPVACDCRPTGAVHLEITSSAIEMPFHDVFLILLQPIKLFILASLDLVQN